MVNLYDLVDWAIILAVALYLRAVVATELFGHWRRPPVLILFADASGWTNVKAILA